MLKILTALPHPAGEGFSPLDYGAVCSLSALAQGTQVWVQLDSAGQLTALLSARFLSLAEHYPRELAEELRLFLTQSGESLLCLDSAAARLGLTGEPAQVILCRELADSPSLPSAEECGSGELWEFLCAVFPEFAAQGVDAFRASLFAGRKSGRRWTRTLRENGALIACGEITHSYGGTGILENIAVAESRRGGGLGRRIVDTLCAQSGLRRALAACEEELAPFYEKAGFVRCGRMIKL